MKGSLRAVVSLAAATFVALGQGCDGRPSMDTSTTEVTVTGVVKVKGQPASGGQISFNPSNRDRKVSAFTSTIGQDGSYSIKTYTGENMVTFGGEVAKTYPALGITKKYCVVTGGGQQQDFDLLGDEQPAGYAAKGKMMEKGPKGTTPGGRGRRQ
jgi:hypothetical protein